MANWAWLAPKPRNAPHTGLFVRTATERTSMVGHVVRPAGVAGRPLEHLHAHAGVGARVADHPDPERGEAALGIAAGPVLHLDRMALGVDEEALLARQRALHRALQQPGRQRGLGLVGHVLLAAERAAVGHQLDGDRVGVDAEDRGDLVAVVPHALPARVHVQVACRAVGVGHGQRGLGLEEGVLDALGLEHLVHDVGAGGQRGVDVAPPVLGHRQHVGVRAPHRDLGVVDRGDGVGERPEHVVVDLDQLGRGPGLLAGLGHDDGEHVAGVGRAAALGDEIGQSLWMMPTRSSPGTSAAVNTADHARRGPRRVDVDAADVGAGVVGQAEGGVQHARHAEVVDVAPVAERELARLVLGAAGPDAAGQRTAASSLPAATASMASSTFT